MMILFQDGDVQLLMQMISYIFLEDHTQVKEVILIFKMIFLH